jgi:periplasmic protein TonB
MYVPLDITTRPTQRHLGPGMLAVLANAAFIALFALGLGVTPKEPKPVPESMKYVNVPAVHKPLPEPNVTTDEQLPIQTVYVPLPDPPTIPFNLESPSIQAAPIVEPSQGPQTGSIVEPPIAHARLLRHAEPAYPTASIRAHEEGTVMLQVLIGPDGRIGDVRLAASSGFERLDAAAIKEVRTWRFAPATRGGRAISMWVSVPVKYELR